MLVIAVGGWLLGISPVLDQASAASAQAAQIGATNSTSVATLASLKQQFSHIDTLQGKLDSLRGSIPEEASASTFLTEIDSLCATYNVQLVSVIVAAASVYKAPDAAAVTTPTPAGGTSTPTPTPSPSSTVATSAPTTISNGLILVPVSIEVQGDFTGVRDFVGALQTGTRLYFATNVSISTAQGTGLVTGNLTGDAFTLQGTSDIAPTKGTAKATSAPTPTATPTPTPTATSKSTSTPIPTATPTSTATPKP
jgi:Tfp pilus assembly protein PilO